MELHHRPLAEPAESSASDSEKIVKGISDSAAASALRRLAEVKRQSLEALREYSTDRGMSFPAHVLIVSATKSS